ncbi:HAMP domain-containing sensor histidine kinase [Acinetobacter corruptisaponis]|uniref:histidine kinase n=1 Tax=Acinetobacter corruptisaponis TaxID=3045147 RepID=A0ABY8S482_9GAMM|nr:HAMP domain-containing sensor histidine kinase [Acinetobacter sp. KCTC 92772]WHP05652.1 HAMP domain-containing sensor histidine kinase [Acinetobacter sp. KCTC 92772]
MIRLPNLRKNIVIGLVGYTLLLSFAVGLHGFLVNEHIEKLVWQNILGIDFENFNLNKIRAENNQDSSNNNLKWYDENQNDRIPAEFSDFEVGIHDEVEYQDRVYVIRVTEKNDKKQILALDITEIEKQEFYVVFFAFVLMVFSIILITYIAYNQLGKLINPLLSLANDLSRLTPIQDQIQIDRSKIKYYESYVLSDAIQNYVERSQHYLEKEKVFFSTVSHELRTPVSVILGAIEVLQHHQSTPATVLPHLDRIARITQDMEELIACLLFLARDQQRLNLYAEEVDLYHEIPVMIEHHISLCKGKNVEILNLVNQPFRINVPPQLIRVVVSNLLRNAIENCDDGTIKIYQHDAQIMIEDSGHGMSAEALSTFYTSRARMGNNQSAGIGIPLILKICDHFGWSLTFKSKPEKGTIAILKFS